MAVMTRSASGTFATKLPRDERTVFEIIRQLALRAAECYEKDPTEVTQAECDSCADAEGLVEQFGPIPLIHKLLEQVPGRDGKPYRYRKLLRDLFDEERSFEHVRREMVTAADWPDLDEGHIDYALNRVADFKEVTTFSPATYDVYRDDLIRDEARHRRSAKTMTRRLPTSDQIIRFYGVEGDVDDGAAAETATAIWNRALQAHGLESQPIESWQARAVRVPEAIRRFYEKTGLLPSKKGSPSSPATSSSR